MIHIDNLCKSFDGFWALNGVTLHVEKGSVYGLLGPNGAGKTTLIKHLAGIYTQNSGTIAIDGKSVFENTDTKFTIFITTKTINIKKIVIANKTYLKIPTVIRPIYPKVK